MSYSAKELARQFGTDARTFRKFLRDITPREEQPGQGKRWALPENKRAVARMKKNFDEWNTPRVEDETDKVEERELDSEIDEEELQNEDAEDGAAFEKSLGEAMVTGLLGHDPTPIDDEDFDLEPTEEDLLEIEGEEG